MIEEKWADLEERVRVNALPPSPDITGILPAAREVMLAVLDETARTIQNSDPQRASRVWWDHADAKVAAFRARIEGLGE